MLPLTAPLSPGPQGELGVSEQGEGPGTAEHKRLHSYPFNGGIFLLYQAKSFHHIKSWNRKRKTNQVKRVKKHKKSDCRAGGINLSLARRRQ